MNDKLCTQELEILCQAYLDCQLSRLEEKELELVLLTTPECDSEIVSKARQVMAIETAIGYKADKESIVMNSPVAKPYGTAASVAFRILRFVSSTAAAFLIILYVWLNTGGRPSPKAEADADYEQCLAKYKDGYSFDDCTDLHSMKLRYTELRKPRTSIILLTN